MDKRFNYDIFIVGGLALIVRLIYVSQLAATPFFDAPIVDAEFHDAWARDIIERGMGHEGTFFRAPLYPYFLALIYKLTNGSYFAARLVQVLLGTSTAILTYLLAYALVQKRAVALIAGVGAALYGMLVYFDGELLVETLFIPLTLSACLTYAKWRNGKKASLILIPGVLLGLAIITRPSAMIILLVFAADLLLAKGIIQGGDLFLKRMLRVFVITTGCFLPILPVTWHNVNQGGDFVLVGSSGGVNFYIGNNPKADGLHSIFPDIGTNWDVPYASIEAFRAEGKILKPSEVSDHYYKSGWRYIVANPVDAGKLLLRKFFAFWYRSEISNNRDLYFFINETTIMPYLRLLGFWLIAPLGLLGFWIGLRRKLLPDWFLWIMPVYMFGVVAFFITARFRIPIVPFLLILTGAGLYSMLADYKKLLSRKSLINIFVLIVLVLFVNMNLWGFGWDNEAHAHFSLGNAYLKKGNLEGAQKAYGWALRIDPAYPLVHLNLGVAAYRVGDFKRAEAEYLKELVINPNLAMAYNNLGVLRFEEGNYEEARQYYETAHQLQPYFDDARINLAECLFKLGLEEAQEGQVQKAADHFGQAIQLNRYNALYHYNYALATGQMGYADIALKHLQEALRIAPHFTEARSLLIQIEKQTSGHSELSP